MTEDQFARLVEYAEGRFQQLPTKDDLARLEARLEAGFEARLESVTGAVSSLRQEMRERFEIIHDRIVALEKGQQDLRLGLATVHKQVDELTATVNQRMDKLEAQARETNTKLIDLKEEVQQRFRIVTDRLIALEQRIAA